MPTAPIKTCRRTAEASSRWTLPGNGAQGVGHPPLRVLRHPAGSHVRAVTRQCCHSPVPTLRIAAARLAARCREDGRHAPVCRRSCLCRHVSRPYARCAMEAGCTNGWTVLACLRCPGRTDPRASFSSWDRRRHCRARHAKARPRPLRRGSWCHCARRRGARAGSPRCRATRYRCRRGRSGHARHPGRP